MSNHTLQSQPKGSAHQAHSAPKAARAEKSKFIDASSLRFSAPAGAPRPHVQPKPQGLPYLQRTLGNRAVRRFIQAKLTVGPPGDKFEQEADRVADTVMRMPDPVFSRETAFPTTARNGHAQSPGYTNGSARMQRQVQEEEPIQAKPLALQITPLLQRQIEEGEGPMQAKPLLQRQPEEEEMPVQAKFEVDVTPQIQRTCKECQEEMRRQPAEEEKEKEMRRDQPMGGKEEKLRRQPVKDEKEEMRRQPKEEEKKEKVQAKASFSSAPVVTPSVQASISSIHGGGKPLPASTRNFFEPRFGHDFSQVRVHTDAHAAETARAVTARAFTLGRDVVFGAGEYAPDTIEGKKLLAHELTHTIQQGCRGDTSRSNRFDTGKKRIQQMSEANQRVQRTVDNLAVAGADPEVGHPNHFVVHRQRGTAEITATLSDPALVVRWTGGRRQPGNNLQRLASLNSASDLTVTADTPANPGARSVTIHRVNARAAGPNTPATLRFSRRRGNPPGLVPFGLTDIRTENPNARIRAFLEGNHWVFRVERIRHRFMMGVTGGGNTDIPSARSGNIPGNYCPVITDLTPPAPGAGAGPPRAAFWSRPITLFHEQCHVNRFYSPPFWEAFMRVAEATIEAPASNVNFDHTIPNTRTAAAVVAANMAGFQATLDAQHVAADAAEFVGSEVACHDQSNPRYTTLVTAIAARRRPTSPTALVAVATGPTTVNLTWTDNACNETEYRVHRRQARRSFQVVASLPAGSAAFIDTTVGLQPNTRYTYHVTAVGAAGESRRSNRVNVTTPP